MSRFQLIDEHTLNRIQNPLSILEELVEILASNPQLPKHSVVSWWLRERKKYKDETAELILPNIVDESED